MRKVFFLLFLAMAVTMMGAVATTPHDLSVAGPGATATTTTQVCVFCHTPHQDTIQTDPLWNQEETSTSPFGVYDSTTLDHAPAEIGGTNNTSLLCMSCHDGTVAVGSLYNDPNDEDPVAMNDGGLVVGGVITGTANLGIDLTDDHPINFVYNNALDAGLVAAPGNGVLRGGEVQCASCHDPHDNSVDGYGFLRVTMDVSALCTECHIK
ncbi:MAG TPA: cytochrome c3 family protein [Thermoanaerobaculia bacterium]|nr:cytochrome c3 family protein [Thermoanaerobaculia bacterium]HUM29127.1 cytochrome c3 family protein [Thermoanaerobaculia bacterium]HXK67504.1 cytochrome c3 family protein [Thermoanaerobaculia bacterium]